MALPFRPRRDRPARPKRAGRIPALPFTTRRASLRPETHELAVSVRGLVNGFGEQIVHDGLDLDVRAGEIIGIVGGSGTGKSVLLRSIIGLQKPMAGEIKVFGVPMRDVEDIDELRDVRRRWGVMFQGGALFSTLTVAENIQVPLREYYPQLDQTLLDEIAAFKTRLVGLPAEAGPKYPAELSGGMVKRAGLARALALDPALLFLDEPTAGLDPIGAANFDALIRQLRASLGLTVFLITHDLDSLYATCDRIAVLAEKKVIAVGTIDELLATGHPWIEEYFGGPRGRAASAAALRKAADEGLVPTVSEQAMERDAMDEPAAAPYDTD